MMERERRKHLLKKESSYVRRMGYDHAGRMLTKPLRRLLEMLANVNHCKRSGEDCRATELRARRLLIVMRKRTLKNFETLFTIINIIFLALAFFNKVSLSSFVWALFGDAAFILIMSDHLRMIAHHAKIIKELKASTTGQGAQHQQQVLNDACRMR